MKEIKVHKGTVRLLQSKRELEGFFSQLEDGSTLTFDWETTGLEYDALPLGLAMHQKGVSPVFCPVDYFFTCGVPMEEVAEVCNREFSRLKLIAHNAKFDSMINVMNGIRDENCRIIADTLVMIHLYDCNLAHKLETRVKEDFGYEKQTFEQIIGKKWHRIDWKAEGDGLLELLAGYAGEDAYWETQVYHKYRELLDEDMWRVHDRIELPTVRILRDAKIRGVLIDVPFLQGLKKRAESQISQIVEEIYNEAGCVFNLNSNPQKQKVFFEKLKLPVVSQTKSGAPSTDSNTAEVWAENGIPIGKLLVKYSELQKLVSGYLNPIPQMVDRENVLRGDINSCGTKTGRCIEENQRVLTVGGLTPIKDVHVGDLVYCYDNEGRLHIRKVLNKFENGKKRLVRVKWQSSGDAGRTGVLLCTPDHLVKTKNRGWIKAKDLQREKVYHLCRRPNFKDGKLRPRLYGSNGYMELEQVAIKTLYFHAPSDMHVHHLDGNPLNNRIENLRVLTGREHAKIHLGQRMLDGSFKPYNPAGTHRFVPSGKDNPKWISRSKISLLRMLFKAGGRPTMVPMDFATYKRKCDMEGIRLSEVCKRFNNDGEYISKTRILNTEHLAYHRQCKSLHLGFYRLRELKEYYGVTNHLILSVKNYGRGNTWDIEVAEFNNFICEEICVHNCSSARPNLQNMPNNHDFPVRQAFIPRPGYVLINYDYSQLELRVMAHISKDPTFIDIFNHGRDPHGEVAKALGITRREAKVANFGVLYGMSDKGFAEKFGVSEEEAHNIVENYHTTYYGFAKWKENNELYARRYGCVKNLFGRMRRLPMAATPRSSPRFRFSEFSSDMRRATNSVIQGTGADIVKLATIAMCKKFEELNLDAHFLLQVHDEVLVEARYDQMLEAEKVVVDAMENTTKLCIPLEADGKILLNWGEMKDETTVSVPQRGVDLMTVVLQIGHPG